MPSPAALKNLEGAGQLLAHAPTLAELQMHLTRAGNLLADSRRKANSLDTRFDIANSAGHALLMAALKMKGFRPSSEKGHRAILYQLLEQLVPAAANAKETLDRIAKMRNRAEYDGDDLEITQSMVDGLIEAVVNVQEEVMFLFNAYQRKRRAANATVASRKQIQIRSKTSRKLSTK